MSNVSCYRLQTYIWQIHGVTWHRKSLDICREFPLRVQQFQKPQIARLPVVPCSVTRFMCNQVWQSSGPVPRHHRGREGWGCFSMAGRWRWCLGYCSGGENWKDLWHCSVMTYLHRCDQAIVCVSSVLLLSIAVSSLSLAVSKVGSGPFVEVRLIFIQAC